MNITERFVADILKKEYPTDYQLVYEESPLLQYLDKKMKAVHGNSKTRRSLANMRYILSYIFTRVIFTKRKANTADLKAMIICVCSIFIVVYTEEINYKIML